MKTEQARAASNGSTADSAAIDATPVAAHPAARRRWKRWGAVLKVPNTAVRFHPPGAPGSMAPVVWIFGRDGRPVAAPVTLGITDGTSTEIMRGDLEAGQTVLIGLESAAPTTTIPGPGFRL